MPFRLVFRLPDRTAKVVLAEGLSFLGADAACEVVLDHPTVSGRHARLEVQEGTLSVEDLGSANGTYVAGRRFAGRMEVVAGTLLAFGAVAAQVEEVGEGDQEEAFRLERTAGEAPSEGKPVPDGPAIEEAKRKGRETWASALHDGFFTAALPGLLADLDEGATPAEMAARVGAALWRHFPCSAVAIRPRSPRGAAAWFAARREEPEDREGGSGDGLGEAAAAAQDDELEVVMRFSPASLAPVYTPVAEIALGLLRLAGRTATPRQSPRTPGEPPPLPAPETLHAGLRRIYERAARLAAGDVSVLIRGDSGTGKEVLARYVHAASGRTEEQLIALNCAALPRDLLELELFGIEAGVATGVDPRPGKFELADGGTLFLDEVGDMALATQAKILRVLQEKAVYRIGGKNLRPARVQVVSATNRDLDALVKEGAFRRDLFYRLAGWEVELPPLHRRHRDIPNLAAHFLTEEARKLGLDNVGISRAAMDALQGFPWPGNVRELQHEIRRGALLLEDGELLETSHLRRALREAPPQDHPGGGLPLKETLEEAERKRIREVLEDTNGHLEQAAQVLDISRSTLYRRLRSLGLTQAED